MGKSKGATVTGTWISRRVLITGKRRLNWAGAVEGTGEVVVRKMLRKPSRQAMGLKGWEVRKVSSQDTGLWPGNWSN